MKTTFETTGYAVLPVLPFLKGHELNELAYRIIHSLRPSCVRVSKDGWVKSDGYCWRVTVFLDKDGMIDSIDQEVEIGGGTGCDLYNAMREAGIVWK